ncbi:DUF4870 domain-containing protein [Opitutus terrae]|uniref:DUF4870 domain-containing protein n=1 Tax=Opitutus terrae (strain DSM 11246 / JCM 15787 / PB90-1) TaxID=452637 RepID=B2A002_OPITP|nr:DUF4870 domain-containing protein [Opitutus terrae]ACB77338.1 hypothetical protein Oter_4064 [Opitutus terrae PB90-1]
MTSSPLSPAAVAAEDKTTAIVSYLTLIGFIVAIVLHNSKKTTLGAFHLRQSLGLMLTSIAMMFVGTVLAFIPYLGWLLSMALWVGLLVLWISGLLAAIQGERKPVPVLGLHYQNWFGNAFE